MTPRDEALLWVQNADGDFAVIVGCLKAGIRPWNQLCFHAQQGAEKYLKAMLVANSIPPPKTHNLAKLLELLVPVDFGVSVLMADCVLLTPFAVAERYAPTPLDEPTAIKVIAAGNRVRDHIRPLVT